MRLGDNLVMHEFVPDDVIKSIRQEIETSTFNIPYQEHLAGNIKEEYALESCFDTVKYYVEEVANLYKQEEYELESLWVNFMKKHEFNPCHTHGGDLSFVMFIEVPYDIKDEEKVFPDAGSPCAGYFFFQYCDILGKIAEEQIPVDKTYEEKMFMFPAGLRHGVYPFYTSDKHRITVSGNLRRL